MADTGLEAYRFSISWSRLIPSMHEHPIVTHIKQTRLKFSRTQISNFFISDGKGPVNPKGLQYYNNLIDQLISHGYYLPYDTTLYIFLQIWGVVILLGHVYLGMEEVMNHGTKLRNWKQIN